MAATTPTPATATTPDSSSSASGDKWEPDFSQYEAQFEKGSRDSLAFTETLAVHSVARSARTAKSSLPADLLAFAAAPAGAPAPSADPVVRAAVGLYTQPWSVVSVDDGGDGSSGGHHHKKTHKKTPTAPTTVAPAAPLANLSYEVDDEAFRQPASFDVDRELVTLTSEPPALPARPSLFRVFPVAPPTRLQTPTAPAKPRFEPQGMQLTVEYRGLFLDTGMLEPFRGAVFLYDWDWREKVTESFAFEAGKDALTSSFPICAMRVEQPRPTVCLVVVLYHVLRGEYDAMVDPYFKPPVGKELGRWQADIKEATARLGSFRQAFAWGAIPLFGDDGALLATGDVRIENFSRIKEELPAFLTKTFSDKDRGKTRAIPGYVTLRLSEQEYGEQQAPQFSLIDHLLLPVVPPGPEGTPTARELFTFSAPEDVVVPHLDYVNMLFFYPEALNFSNYRGADCSARNILTTVRLMESDMSAEAQGMAACYGGPVLSNEARFSVQYHQKKPKWMTADEVKMQLPHTITPVHHILVTFYHVDCKLNKKSRVETPTTLLGYCVIPLLDAKNEIIRDGKDMRPVALQLPPSYMKAVRAESDFLKWIDGGKPLFTFRVKVVSSIYTQDVSLSHFLRMAPDEMAVAPALTASLDGTGDPDALLPPPARMAKCVDMLQRTPASEKVRFLPLLLSKLLSVITFSEEIVSHAAFVQLLLVLDSVEKEVRSKVTIEPVLESYVEYIYSGVPTVKSTVHERLVSHWITTLYGRDEKSIECGRISVEFSWFLFGIVFKDMVLTLKAENKLGTKRPGRFSDAYVSLLKKLVDTMGAQMMIQRRTLKLSRELNASTAFFLRNMLDVLDRGVVFEMIFRYIGLLDPANAFLDVQEHKFTALRIILEHSQVAQLNLPSDESLTSISDVDNAFFQRHFLAGLLLREAKVAMCSPESDLRMMALRTVLDVLHSHDRDPLLADSTKRHRVAYMYFPFLLAAIDNIPTVFSEEKTSATERAELQVWFICYLYIVQGAAKLLSQWWKVEVPKRLVGFLDLFPRIADLFRYPGKNNCSSFDFMPLGPIEDDTPSSAHHHHRHAHGGSTASSGGSAAAAAVVTPMPTPLSASSPAPPSAASPQPLGSQVGIRQYKSRREMTRLSNVSRAEAKSRLEEKYASLAAAASGPAQSPRARPPMLRRGLSQSQPTRRWTSVPFTNLPKRDDLVLMYKNLCLETSMISLETTFTFVSHASQQLSTPEGSDFLTRIFQVYTSLFRRDQSREFLTLLFYSLQVVMRKFKKQIFREQSPICQIITGRVIELCDSKDPSIRAKAASTLCNMITFNSTEMKNFSRMKLQATIAISRLVVNRADFEFVKQTLEAVNRFFSKTPLASEMQQLRDRLFVVIRDSINMKEYQHDREMTAELFHHISRGFLDSPDLRLTWLDNLASFHRQNKDLQECAQTKIMMAALVARYLATLHGFPVTVPDSEWGRVFPNFSRESGMPVASTLQAIKAEICTGPEFSAQGYERLLRDAVELLRSASNFEECVETYQLLLPLHRGLREYGKQARVYKDLHTLCIKIVEEAKANSRVAPNYYRVAFYGKGFGAELDGKQFIYKESCFVRIAEFTERLQKQYAGRVEYELIPNTKEVNPKDLDPNKCYLQLGAVTPVRHDAPEDEAAEKRTALEQHFNVDRFMMEMPFTKSGKAHGELSEQWKKKIVFHTEGSFPHLKKRLLIIKKDESVVTPIRNAIELIQDKVAALQTELSSPTPSTKTLQIQLNGALLAFVNAGPVEICRVFLSAENRAKLSPQPTKAELAELGEVIAQFVRKLGFGLKCNGKLIGPEQKPLQDQLELAYVDFQAKIRQYTGTAEGDPAATGAAARATSPTPP